MASLGTAVRAETVLDVLVLYTNDLLFQYKDHDGVKAQAMASVASANLAFENSEVAIRLRLRAVEKINYTESEDDMDIDLDFISKSSVVAALRDEVGADLVCLFNNWATSEVAGVAWLLDDVEGKPTRGFSVTSAQSAISAMVFQHEVGHNLGGAHDRDNSDSGGLYPYSHGHRFGGTNSAEYRTIMAYAPGHRINYFSNSEITYSGTPTGVATGEEAADNAKTFNQTGLVVDAYRAHLHLNPIADAGGDRRVEDLDRDGFATIHLDSSQSIGETIVSWEWTWAGGSSTNSIIDLELPIGSTEFTLAITDDEGFLDEDTIFITVIEYSPVVAVEAGAQAGFYVKESGDVYAFGDNQYGQLGMGRGGRSLGSPIITVPGNIIETPTKGIFDKVESVSSSAIHTFFKLDDGSLWGVGFNSVGQLGDGTNVWRQDPVRIFEGGVQRVSAEGGHSLFLFADGSLWGTGENYSGQLGIGGVNKTSIPIQIVGGGVESISTGRDHSAWVKSDGSLWSVGMGSAGQLGDGSFGSRFEPVEIVSSGVSKVSAGGAHTLILMDSGSVLWTGTLSGGRSEAWSSPQVSMVTNVPVEIIGTGVIDISAGRDFSLFLMEDGSLWVLGENWFDQVGGARPNWAPEPVQAIESGVAGMDAGREHCLILRDDGSVWGIGRNERGQLGLKVSDSEAVAKPIVEAHLERTNVGPRADAGPDMHTISGTGSYGGRVMLDGSGSSDDWQVVSWRWSWDGNTIEGKRVEGAFDVGETRVVLEVSDDEGAVHRDELYVSVGPQTRVMAVLAGDNQTFLLKEDGSLWASGRFRGGLLGTGEMDLLIPDEKWIVETFRLVVYSGVKHIQLLSMGISFVKEDGSLWGIGSGFQVNGEGISGYDYSPVELISSGVKSAYAGGEHSLILMTDGSLWGMGKNQYGQLGVEYYDSARGPFQIVDSGVVAASAAGFNSMFVKSDGSLWGMGENVYGQLGDGSTSSRSSPVMILSSDVSGVSLSGAYSLILRNDGTVWGSGNLPGDYVDSATPIQLSISDVVKIEAAGAASFAVKSDGSLYAIGAIPGWIWPGYKSFTKVFSSRVRNVSSRNWRTFIVLDDGSLWGAGRSSYGEFGTGLESRFDKLTELLAFDFPSWLEVYFSEGEIAAWGDGAREADPDFDGLSNEREQVLGLDPRVAFNPLTDTGARVRWLGGRIAIEIADYVAGLNYTVWASDNLVHWEKVSLPSFMQGEALYFELPGDSSHLYRVEVSE